MRNENDRAVLDQVAFETLLDDPTCSMDIKSREYVVEEKDLSGGIECPRQSETSLERVNN